MTNDMSLWVLQKTNIHMSKNIPMSNDKWLIVRLENCNSKIFTNNVYTSYTHTVLPTTFLHDTLGDLA